MTIWGIVGSVSFEVDLLAEVNFKNTIRALVKPTDFIVCGGHYAGPDRWTKEVAREIGCEFEVISSSRTSSFEKDMTIIESCDQLVVFWDGTAAATRATIARAVRSKKMVTIYNPGGSSKIS